PGIAALIEAFAQRGKMLFRSHAELYEAIRDFFVAQEGGKVVGICALEIQWVFALTYEQAFFEKLGFAVVDKSALPLKVWSVCIKCPKRDGCDEIAMVKTVWEGTPVAEDEADGH